MQVYVKEQFVIWTNQKLSQVTNYVTKPAKLLTTIFSPSKSAIYLHICTYSMESCSQSRMLKWFNLLTYLWQECQPDSLLFSADACTLGMDYNYITFYSHNYPSMCVIWLLTIVRWSWYLTQCTVNIKVFSIWWTLHPHCGGNPNWWRCLSGTQV